MTNEINGTEISEKQTDTHESRSNDSDGDDLDKKAQKKLSKTLSNADAAKRDIAWIRSEQMSLCQLFLQTESAYACVDQFGTIGMIEFRDLNPDINSFQRKFVNELRRCDEMERQLDYFDNELSKDKMPILEYDEEPETPAPREMSNLEAQFTKIETDLREVNKSASELKKNFLEFTELRYILKKTGQFFEDAQEHPQTRKEIRRVSIVDPRLMRRFSTQIESQPEMSIPLDPITDINFIAGTILRQKFHSFEQMLWRVCRGNIFMRSVDIEEKLEDPKTGEMQTKCIFIIVFQGEALKAKCKKICEGFHTTLYPCPERPNERNDMHAGVVNRLDDLQVVMKQTDDHRSRILVAVAKNLLKWKVSVRKMKSVYETLNKFNFDITSKCLIAECWCPVIYIPTIQEAMVKGQKLSQSAIPSVLTRMETNETPPTLNITNKFTRGFQNIVDAYGVSNYGEVNPMPFTCVTFPFLFAVMFGDAGHGLLMFLFALWMVLYEKSLSKKNWGEIWDTFFGGRYIILLMGLFSIYTGFIYNDCFSKAMNIFGSEFGLTELGNIKNGEWHKCDPKEHGCSYGEKIYELEPHLNSTGYAYAFGMDPIWQVSVNKITFLNTYKMKTSVVLGVLQMLFGVMLSIINHVHFKRYINIFVEFIPQVLFLMAIFGYMDFMIFWKWVKYNSQNSGCAPSILITLINMFLQKGSTEQDPCYLRIPMFNGQSTVQIVLLLVALACIPWMLLIKPFYLRYKHNNKKNVYRMDSNVIEMSDRNKSDSDVEINEVRLNLEDSEQTNNTRKDSINTKPNGSGQQTEEIASTGGDHGGHGGDGEFDFGDAFIHQCIHTIEYCLGSISHTASYLRLWALSLAHSELSEVLWNMVFINGFSQLHKGMPFDPMNIASAAIMWVIFAAWAVLTVAILLLMEGLSAFLHALRLHWVEFQSKFYEGAGYAFQPFSYKTIVQEMIRSTD